MKKYLLIYFLFFLISMQNAFAETQYCPTNSGYVEIGDDMAAVLEKCGPPTSKTKVKEKVKEPLQVLQWFYRFQGPKLADLPTMTISFIKDEVSSINVAGEKVDETDVCKINGPSKIKIGDSLQNVQAACGTPTSFYTATQQKLLGLQEIEIWKYKFNDYEAPVQFEFEEGIVRSFKAVEE